MTRRVLIILSVAVILAVGIWARTRNHEQVFFARERVFFTGDSDPYLHMRLALYAYANFPGVVSVDPFAAWPDGQAIGSLWPPGMAWLIAGSTMVVDMIRPKGWHLERVAATLPVVFGVANIALLMLLARRFGCGWAGTCTAGWLYATSPYTILATILGATDHHFLEPTLLLVPALPLLRSLRTAGWRGILLATGAGWTGMLGFWFWHGNHVQLALLLLAPLVAWIAGNGELRPLTRATAFALGLAIGQLMLPECARTLDLGPGHDLGVPVLHLPALWLAPALVLGGMLAIARHLRPRTATMRLLVGLVSGAALSAVAVVGGLSGDFGLLWSIYFNKQSAFVRSIGEFQPLFAVASSPVDCLRMTFGLALVGGALLGLPLLGRQPGRSSGAILTAWTIVAVALATIQVRLAFYATPILALVAAQAGDWVWRRIQGGFTRTAITVGVVVTMVAGVPFITGMSPQSRAMFQTATWIAAATPPTGSLTDKANRPDYGVMTPPFVGNVVVYISARPAVANAQNGGNTRFADFFLAPTETAAAAALKAAAARYVVDLPGAAFQEALIAQMARRPVPVGGGFGRRLRRQLPELSAHLRPVFVSTAAVTLADDAPSPETGTFTPAHPWARTSIIVYEVVLGAEVSIPCAATGPVTLRWTLPLDGNHLVVERTLMACDGRAEGTVPAPILPYAGPVTLGGIPVDLAVSSDDVRGGHVVRRPWPSAQPGSTPRRRWPPPPR